jgi:hypothetical protein
MIQKEHYFGSKKIDISARKKKKNLFVEDAPKHVLPIWISNTATFICLFHCQKTAFACIFQYTPLFKITIF